MTKLTKENLEKQLEIIGWRYPVHDIRGHIAALDAEIAELETERDSYEYDRTNTKLRAENEKLRSALKEISEAKRGMFDLDHNHKAMIFIADQALIGKEGE